MLMVLLGLFFPNDAPVFKVHDFYLVTLKGCFSCNSFTETLKNFIISVYSIFYQPLGQRSACVNAEMKKKYIPEALSYLFTYFCSN